MIYFKFEKFKRIIDQWKMNDTKTNGKIHLIIGPMFAGKSTLLLNKVKEEILNGKKVVLIKSNKDTRYDINSIVTHDGLKNPCYTIKSLEELREIIGKKEYDKLEVLVIDEGHFFCDLLEFCKKTANTEGKIVIIAGIDGDYRREKFGEILDLIPFSDSVVKLLSKCEICLLPAPFTLRKTEDKEFELIGGSEIYCPLCRKHYNERTKDLLIK